MPKKAPATPAPVIDTMAVFNPATILQLDPNKVLADDNTRYSLKESRILTLADSIVSQGGVIEPVEVEPLAPDSNNGFEYRLTMGYYRHAAVKHLNTTQAADLTLPAIVRPIPDAKSRLMRQLAENMERENQSPMDQAIAIQKLMAIGLPRHEIRTMFARPGGRKGAKIQPASNSWLNITLGFLELPKNIQEKIHNGMLTTTAAYQLSKVDPEKRAAVLERAEEERQKELEREEKEEERYLTQEKKALEAKEKQDKAKAEVDTAEAASLAAHEVLETQTKATKELFAAKTKKHDTPNEKKAATKAFNDAEAARIKAETVATEAQKAYEKAQVTYSKFTQDTKKADKAKEIAKAKEKIGEKDVQKAAQDVGAAVGAVPLNLSEIRISFAEMLVPSGNRHADTVLHALGTILKSFIDGVTTPDQFYKEMVKFHDSK